MASFSASADVTAIFCYGIAICDSEWIINDGKKLPEIKNDAVHDYIYDVAFSDKFDDIAAVNNVVVRKWKFEDCDQILLAHQDVIMETDDIRFMGDLVLEDQETEDLIEVMTELAELIEAETGVSIDFNVKPEVILHLYYD